MAARWGVGEESLTTGKIEFFNTYTFVEGDLSGEGEGLALVDQLDPAGSLEPFHGCLDPSILSIFEDSVAIGEAKGRAEEESEATLLTALTEILDNVDDENLSPFDTLPDSELFSGQKGREQSPLRRLLNLARSPPGREPIRGPKSTPPVPGKLESAGVERQQKAWVLPWAQDVALQRSDGEEEEEEEEEGGGDSTPCSEGPFSPDTTEAENTLALDPDGRCVSLTELVKHMHPYCLAICLEPGEVEDGMQMLPEGAIVLEVVGQGEDGGPVLAIESTLSLAEAGFQQQQEDEVEQDISQEVGGSSSSKEESLHPVSALDESDDEEASQERPRGDAFGKCSTGRKKKRKSNEGGGGGCEGRILRGRSADWAEEGPSAPLEALSESRAQTMKKRVTFAPVLASFLEEPVDGSCRDEKTVVPALSDRKLADQLLVGVDMEPCKEASIHKEAPVSQQGEPKSRPLSLQQYWLLRQQKKPTPVEKQEDQSTKWPSLPEPPTELLPIPCLVKPQPSQDQSASKTTPVTEPAWHPVGTDAPPTPQALLVPLASVGTSGKATHASAKPSSVPKAAEGSQGPNPPCEPAALHPPLSQAMIPRQQPSTPTALASRSTIGTTPQPNVLNTNHQARCVLLSRATAQTPKPQSIPAAVKKGPPPKQMVSGPTTRERPQRVAQKRLSLVQMPPLAKRNPRVSQDLTNEIGIEATDLTSLLEQFEETQAKEEKRVPEVCGRAAAVGSSSLEQQPARKPLERPRGPDLGTAGLTPPATPPHQVWKPLTPITLLGKAKQPEGTKPSPSKTPQGTTPQLMPCNRAGCGSPTTVAPSLPQKPVASKESLALAFADHDYCLPSGQPLEPQRDTFHSERQHGAVKLAARSPPSTKTQYVAMATQSSTTCTPPKFISQPLDHRTLTGSVLLSPDSSPCRPVADSDATSTLGVKRPKDRSRGSLRFSERPASPPGRERGRTRRRYRARSSSAESSCSGSSSDSSSGSRSSSSSSSGSLSPSDSSSPPRKRFRSRRSESGSSCSSSRSPPPLRRYSYSSSCSRPWSRSRSRSRSWSPREPHRQWWSGNRSPSYTCRYRYDSRERFQCQDVKERKEKAIEERRVVYVGRIRGGMTRKELKERFSQYGEIEECTLHFRDYGDNYGFVTYYNTKDAFNAIENGSKLRQSDELPFDLCFGGRRQFCKSNYADLDSNREYELVPTKCKYDALDFDTLLKQAQKGLKR